MDPKKMIDNMWTLANAITPFAILQALAFLYALGNSDFIYRISTKGASQIVLWAIGIFTLLYCSGVIGCRWLVKEKKEDCSHKTI